MFCDCPLDMAAARFAARERHQGHLDGLRSIDERRQRMASLRDTYRGTLGLNERLVRVDTPGPIDIERVVDEVRAASAR